MPLYKKITFFSSVSLVVLLALTLSIIFLPRVFGLTPQIIEDHGMSPYYSKGSLIYVRPKNPNELLVGDVITYYENSGEHIMTRRVIAVEEEHQKFYTKADNQSQTESGVVSKRNIIGVPIFQIPYLGIVLSRTAFVWIRWLFFGIAFSLSAITAWNTLDTFKKRKRNHSFLSSHNVND
ncbi:signal peptidase I [Enterococcus durans]|uniref:signal peptidase I n=1 Tax=Enterococcus durans TaxID=53345 RepID=UPI003BDAB1BA